MEKYLDAAGREWRLPINGDTIERVREEIGADLYEYGMQADGEDARNVLQFRVRFDPVLLTKILYAVARRQADDEGVTWDEFAEAMHGDYLWNALQALEVAIVNFTPNPDVRAARAAAVQKTAQMLDAAMKVARQQTERVTADKRLDARRESALAQYVAKCGNMLDSLESDIQGPTPTDS